MLMEEMRFTFAFHLPHIPLLEACHVLTLLEPSASLPAARGACVCARNAIHFAVPLSKLRVCARAMQSILTVAVCASCAIACFQWHSRGNGHSRDRGGVGALHT